MSGASPREGCAAHIVAALISLPASVWAAYCTSRVYLWVLAPALGLPPVGWFAFWGVFALISCVHLSVTSRPHKDDRDYVSGPVEWLLAKSTVFAYLLGLAWLIREFGGAL